MQQGMDSVLGLAFVRGSGNAPTSSERRSEDVVGQARRPAHRGAAPRCLQSQTGGRDLVREPSVCEVSLTTEHEWWRAAQRIDVDGDLTPPCTAHHRLEAAE